MLLSEFSDQSHDALIKQFRAHLHLVITANQAGQAKKLDALSGPKTSNYCRALAELPDNTLAIEIAAPVNAILDQINRATMDFYRPLYHKQITDPAAVAEYEKVLAQLDFAIALIMRRLPNLAKFRARSTKCNDLLCEVLTGMTNSRNLLSLIRRYQKEFEGDLRDPDGSIASENVPDYFAWDTYQRVEALDRLADEFPEHVKTAARYMHAWPMLVHRHTNNRRRFEQLAKRLELGKEYPLDATEGARFRPDTPMVRYLDSLIFKIDYVRGVAQGDKYKSVDHETKSLRAWWWDVDDEPPGNELIEALRLVRQLPALNKSTALQWAEKAVVPIIMLTDARDWKNCSEPALQRIAKQAGVKSRATFKSRLLASVTSTLRRLARPA